MKTANFQYPIPNKYHDVVDDINDLRKTLETIDSDILKTEGKVAEKTDAVGDVEKRVIHCSCDLKNTEIQGIAANRYVVINTTGDGLECLDGGGDAGGTTGQCSIKRTDANFDTAWGDLLTASKQGMSVRENLGDSESNETHIFKDESEIENELQLPKADLETLQSDAVSIEENNVSMVICDEIERNSSDEKPALATKKNFGLVKIGEGIFVDSGVISTTIYTEATAENAGFVKVGDGLKNADGIISRAELDKATHEKFGVVKIGKTLAIDVDGRMGIAEEMAGNAATIYDLGNAKICNNGIIELEEKTLFYRAFVNADLVLQFKYDFEPEADFSFVLEIISDGTHLISFKEQTHPKFSGITINRGTTKIKVLKKLGVPFYELEIFRLDAPEPELLTPYEKAGIYNNYCVYFPNGIPWANMDLIRDYYQAFTNVDRICFEFETLVCVDYVKYWSRSSTAPMGEFILRGSNDGEEWTTLLYRNNEVVYGEVYTDVKGCYKYFDLRIGYTSDDNKPAGVTLWGTQVEKVTNTLSCITPLMSAVNCEWASFTTSKTSTSNSATAVTSDNYGQYIEITEDSEKKRWAQFEFTENQVANVLSLGFSNINNSRDRHATWFKLEASNDESNWNLLLERRFIPSEFLINTANVYAGLFFRFNNVTPYKFYRLSCLATNSTDAAWCLPKFKLYNYEVEEVYENSIPALSADVDKGYVVTASSKSADTRPPYMAFDKDTTTRWVAQVPPQYPEWIQIKLPVAKAFVEARLTSRNDGNLTQMPATFDVMASNDGNNWKILTTVNGAKWSSKTETLRFKFKNSDKFLYYRLNIKSNNGNSNYMSFSELDFVEEGKAVYTRYLEECEYLVPAMTSNEQDGYIASASSIWAASADAYKAFNRAVNGSSDSWQSSSITDANAECSNVWVKIQMPTAKVCNCLILKPREDYASCKVRGPRSFSLKASQNGSTWTELLNVAETGGYEKPIMWDLDNSTAYKYYRLDVFKTFEANQYISIGEIELLNKTIVKEY